MKNSHLKANFFIVGAPKSGTTSLHYYLDLHEDILMSSIKEPNYFSQEALNKNPLYYNNIQLIENERDYHSIFESYTNQHAVGEASVSYLFYPGVAEKIKQYNPDAKIIIMLRNPIERAYSHYLMDFTAGYIKVPFEQILNATNSVNPLIYQQVIELSNYANQVQRYYDTFDSDNIHIILQEEMNRDTVKTVNDVYTFLGVSVIEHENIGKKQNVYKEPNSPMSKFLYRNVRLKTFLKRFLSDDMKSKMKKVVINESEKPKIDAHIYHQLKDFFQDDVNQLQTIIQKDVSTLWDFK